MRKCKLRFQDDLLLGRALTLPAKAQGGLAPGQFFQGLLPQLSQPHRHGQLLHGDTIVDKGFRIVKIRIIRTIAYNQIKGIDIDPKMIDQIALCPSCHRCFGGK